MKIKVVVYTVDGKKWTSDSQTLSGAKLTSLQEFVSMPNNFKKFNIVSNGEIVNFNPDNIVAISIVTEEN